jgi:hypothetical protein
MDEGIHCTRTATKHRAVSDFISGTLAIDSTVAYQDNSSESENDETVIAEGTNVVKIGRCHRVWQVVLSGGDVVIRKN